MSAVRLNSPAATEQICVLLHTAAGGLFRQTPIPSTIRTRFCIDCTRCRSLPHIISRAGQIFLAHRGDLLKLLHTVSGAAVY